MRVIKVEQPPCGDSIVAYRYLLHIETEKYRLAKIDMLIKKTDTWKLLFSVEFDIQFYDHNTLSYAKALLSFIRSGDYDAAYMKLSNQNYHYSKYVTAENRFKKNITKPNLEYLDNKDEHWRIIPCGITEVWCRYTAGEIPLAV